MAQKMTRRERVLAALNHQEADRIPVDFASTHNSGINIVAYSELKKYLGVKSPNYMRDPVPMLASPDLEEGFEMMELLGGDLMPLPRYKSFGIPATDWKPFKLRNGEECLVPGDFNPVETEDGGLELSLMNGFAQLKMPKDGQHFSLCNRPLGFIETEEQLAEILPVLRESPAFSIDDEELEVLRVSAKRLFEETDYAIVASGGPLFFSLYQVSQELFGYEKFLMFMAANPKLVHQWLEFVSTSCIERLGKYLKVLGPYIQVIMMGDDYGLQSAPQMSPKMFKELFRPYLQAVCRAVKEAAPHIKILLHSCGSVAPLIPEFIDAGIDALNPIQVTAANMDPVMLKREFGKDIALWGGGVRTQTTLVNGTKDEVVREIRELLEIFAPGGGYIFCPIHDLQENVPPDKAYAIYQTLKEHGSY